MIGRVKDQNAIDSDQVIIVWDIRTVLLGAMREVSTRLLFRWQKRKLFAPVSRLRVCRETVLESFL